MAIVRSMDFHFQSVEELVDQLFATHSRLSYSKEEGYLQRAEQNLFHPDIDRLRAELSLLTEEFQDNVRLAYRAFGLRPQPKHFYQVLSRTYRDGQHNDFYLCTATLGLKVRSEVLIKATLMRYDEQYHSVRPPQEGIRITPPNSEEDIPDLRAYLAERCRR